ncbi:unnamed protein product, partial [Mesorhabditis belari]|uniref:Tyrosine-protein kinase n=1 Tax=Mesorhabditis belari TaxID=2138241 RepID=A0AAF3FJR0_9BILA
MVTSGRASDECLLVSNAFSFQRIQIATSLVGIAPKNPIERELTNARVDTRDRGVPLEAESYFHGFLPMGIARRELIGNNSQEGLFIVYITDISGEESLVVSVCHYGVIFNYKIRMFRGTLYYINDHLLAKTVPALIEAFMAEKWPLEPSGPQLLRGLPRPSWIWGQESVLAGKVIGKGAFGEVSDGTYGKPPKKCAIKLFHSGNLTDASRHSTYSSGASVTRPSSNSKSEASSNKSPTITDKMMFINEAAILATITHKAVIQLYGVLIHRDLAARNILIDESARCKISDFGISVFGKEVQGDKRLKVAIRWLSPEAIEKGIFSSKSDVWSFGVVTWEIFTNGAVPYQHVKSLKDVKIAVVRNKLRLKATQEMPAATAEMMALCFEEKAERRPSFDTLKNRYKPSSMGRLTNCMPILRMNKSKGGAEMKESDALPRARDDAIAIGESKSFFESDQKGKKKI